jgi:hypothetical protein
MTMPGHWVRKRAASRAKKDARKASSWSYTPTQEPEAPVKPEIFTPSPVAHDWYEFCTGREVAYRTRGEHVAAMVYWALRTIGDPDLEGTSMGFDPCTEEGYAKLCEYWTYKTDWMQSVGQL